MRVTTTKIKWFYVQNTHTFIDLMILRIPSLRPMKRALATRLFHSSIAPFSDLSKVRNIGIIAHIDAGKTTTTERMLFYSGITARIGNVDQGDTVTDYLPAERERGITIQSAAITIPWNSHKINLIDTPGHADFSFEVIKSLKVLDGAVTILDAVAGVEAQTEKVWKQSEKIPKVVFINKMDRDGAGYSRTIKEVIGKLGTRVLLVDIPLFEQVNREQKFVGVIDIVNMKVLKWNNDQITVLEPTEEQFKEISRCRESLIETLSEIDEDLMDSLLEHEDYLKVPSNLINASIRKSTLSRHAVPVLCGASFRNIGVQPLLDAVTLFLPTPREREPELNCDYKLGSNGFVINNNNNLTVGIVFKIITDPIRGVLNFVRVYSGKLQSNSSIYVNGESLRIGKLLVMHANVPEEVGELTAGNIGVIVSDKLKTGDTILSHVQKKKLQQKDLNVVVNPIIVPQPVFSISLEPRTSGDKRSLDDALTVLLREDPSLKLNIDEETGQIVLSGLGELHLEIAKDRLIDLKAKIEIGKIMVSYKETILERRVIEKSANGVGLSITIEPNPKDLKLLPKGKQYSDLGDNNFFINDYEPKSWINKVMSYQSVINSLISGAISSIQRGPILKVPLNSVIIKVDKISIPDDFNNTMELINLIRQSILETVTEESNYQLMEPIMKVLIEVNSQDLGNVVQDLTSQRKGTISSISDLSSSTSAEMIEFNEIMEKQYVPEDPTLSLLKKNDFNGLQLINAEVPLKEMIGYLPKLRSVTQGRATFNMEFKGMEKVTSERYEEIIENN